MLESGKNKMIFKRSYEISYGIWMLAAGLSETYFADKLLKGSVEIVEFSKERDYRDLARLLEKMKDLLRFGSDVNIFGPGVGSVIIQEIEDLRGKLKEIEDQRELSIGGMFRKLPEESDEKISNEVSGNVADSPEIDIGNPAITLNFKAANRQAAILERIRQIGNCRLGDIQLILPDCSERTIRYDLEYLAAKGIIERMGTGGRSVYYQLKSENRSTRQEENDEQEIGNFLTGNTL